MRYFSLFTGIGGFELGIGTKHKCIGYSEIDKYAVQIYQQHYSTHTNYGDITKIDEKNLPDFELLVGGFPCQSFSIAGQRKGFNDTRGTLFFDIARILRSKQSRLFLLENVKGLLNHDDGKTFKTIIVTLDELGYDLQWQVLNSKDFGVPQNRERVFIVGHLRGTRRPKVFPFTENDTAAIQLPRHIANTLTARYEGAQAVGTYIGEGQFDAQTAYTLKARGDSGIDKKHPQTLIRTTADGFHHYRDDKKKSSIQGTHVFYPKGKTHALNTGHTPMVLVKEATKKGYAEAQIGDSINLSVPNSSTRRGRVGKKIAQTLDTGMQQHTLEPGGVRRLTPTECERLQGFPDGWTAGVSDTQRYKCLGNAVTVNVIRAIVERMI